MLVESAAVAAWSGAVFMAAVMATVASGEKEDEEEEKGAPSLEPEKRLCPESVSGDTEEERRK